MLSFANSSGNADYSIVRETWVSLIDQLLSSGVIYHGDGAILSLDAHCLQLEKDETICLGLLSSANSSGNADYCNARETWASLIDQPLSRVGIAHVCHGYGAILPLDAVSLQLENDELVEASAFLLTTKNGSKPLDFKGKATFNVIICWITVCVANFLLGYDIGVLGAVTYTEDFLWEFFYADLSEMRYTETDNHCQYQNQYLQLLTSTLYIVALLSAILLFTLGSRWGHQRILRISSILTLLGVGLSTMTGVGLEAQVLPSFISEIPHTKMQEDMNVWSQIASSLGTLAADIISLSTSNWHPWGWRVSYGVAINPATLLVCCTFLNSETPASLVKHRKLHQAKLMLTKTRGYVDINEDFDWIIRCNDLTKKIQSPIKTPQMLKP